MHDPANATLDSDGARSEERQRRSVLAPITILTLALVLVWVAAFFIPSGEYTLDESGSPVAGSFREIESPLDFGDRVWDLLLAPINGLYGIQDPEGQVGPFNRGKMSCSCLTRSYHKCTLSAWLLRPSPSTSRRTRS
ncbi:MAG: hypothetical protein ACREKS_23505 [Candidatus Rokuibacteriota bacterium]